MTDKPPVSQDAPTARQQRVLDYAAVPECGLYGSTQGTWRSLLEIVLVLGCFCGWLVAQGSPAVGSRLDSLFGGSPIYGQVVANGCVVLTLIVLVTVLGGSSHRDLGLRGSGVVRDLGLGFLAVVPAYCWTAMLSVALAVLAAQFTETSLEAMAEDKLQMLTLVAGVSPLMVVPLTLLIGLYEELLFRGFLLGRLVKLTGSVPVSIILSSAVFGLMHLPGQGWMGFVQTSFLGLILALLSVCRPPAIFSQEYGGQSADNKRCLEKNQGRHVGRGLQAPAGRSDANTIVSTFGDG